MRRFLPILSLCSVATAADAYAQAPGETIAETVDQGPPPIEKTSYRRQLMIADGIAAGTVGAAVVAGTLIFEPQDFHLPMMVGTFAFTSYVIGAPIIHFAHGNVWRGLLSGGARILFPAVGSATLTTALGYEDDDATDPAMAAFGGGLALGAVGAMALDWFVLTPSSYEAAARPTSFVAPTVSVSTEHVYLGVAGAL